MPIAREQLSTSVLDDGECSKGRPFSIRKSNRDRRMERPASGAAWAGIFLNYGLPRLSREQISPSMTAPVFGRESEIATVFEVVTNGKLYTVTEAALHQFVSSGNISKAGGRMSP